MKIIPDFSLEIFVGGVRNEAIPWYEVIFDDLKRQVGKPQFNAAYLG